MKNDTTTDDLILAAAAALADDSDPCIRTPFDALDGFSFSDLGRLCSCLGAQGWGSKTRSFRIFAILDAIELGRNDNARIIADLI